MKKNKILIVSNMYPTQEDPSYGTFVKVMEDGLRKYVPHLRIDLVAIKGRGKSKFSKLYKYIKFYIELLRLTMFGKYDMIYVHTITFPTPALRIASIFRNLILVFNIHGVDLLTKTKYTEKLKNLSIPLLKKSKFIVVPSTYYKDLLFKLIPIIEEDKVVVSPSGGLSKNFFHQKYTISTLPLKIGYVSRIVTGKGWDTFVRAMKILDEKKVPFNAIMVGSGNMENKLNQLILELSFVNNNSLKFIGPLGHNELSSFYNNLDVFVFPSESESESLGLVGLEAMAGSTPVIGSNIGGISTYLENDKNGYLFSPGNEIELSQAIIKYYNLTLDEKLKMSNNAYNTALDYETERVCKKLYQTILKP